MDGGGQATDRDGGDAGRGGRGRAVPSRGDQPDAVLRVEKATAVFGEQDLRERPPAEDARRRRAQGGADPANGTGDRRDYRGESGAKKRALGLEDYGQLPPALQKEVHATVVQTRERSGWPAKQTLAALGIARRTYYRWLKEEKWAKSLPEAPVRPVQAYEALPEEKDAVLAHALAHPELRHRELAWRMVDEDVVCLSPSTVYRI